ncbi:2OG-Fe(II) oxygenase [Sandaracinus amylolyticus]|uniref:2OG-Fe(II) oxygenase n=1 Tax=Sandaracinus amylolyticus TaxID=927083 RepID=UPI001F3D1910|nr:2OG-Fe(II) oxygenase [Sandaracinus amylolyticus]UJR84382.1 Hypothetical protein I5071_64610 [Sandaracinus amylolyticus]
MSDASPWEPLVVDRLGPAALDALIDRRVPYVHVPRFLDPAWCDEVVARFSRAIEELPEHRELRMGPMCFDALAKPVELFVDSSDPAAYFAHAAADAPRVRALFAGGDDPLEKMRDAWRAHGFREVPSSEGEDRTYNPDTVWAIRSAVGPPHVDWYERERPSALSRFPRRLNYNVYLQRPDSGGHFVVYRRFATDVARNEQPWRDPEAAAASLRGVERVEHQPAPGDLVIFDAHGFHEVTRVDGSRRRRVQVHACALVDPATRELSFFV